MAIPPISGVGPVKLPAGVSSVGKPTGPAGGSFGEMLRGCVDHLDQTQQTSAGAIQDYLTGKTNDVVPVVSAVAKADLSFKLLIGVRNKVIEAYRQTINMNV